MVCPRKYNIPHLLVGDDTLQLHVCLCKVLFFYYRKKRVAVIRISLNSCDTFFCMNELPRGLG